MISRTRRERDKARRRSTNNTDALSCFDPLARKDSGRLHCSDSDLFSSSVLDGKSSTFTDCRSSDDSGVDPLSDTENVNPHLRKTLSLPRQIKFRNFSSYRHRAPVIPPAVFKRKKEAMISSFLSFSDHQRNLFLSDLLRHACSSAQLHTVSQLMAGQLHSGCPPNCTDPLSWLPLTVSMTLLSWLDGASLAAACAVSCRWRQLCGDQLLWMRLVRRDQTLRSRSARYNCLQIIRHLVVRDEADASASVGVCGTTGCAAGGSPLRTHCGRRVDWKGIFGENYRCHRRWLSGRPLVIRTLEGHSQGVSCVQLDATRLVSASSDQSIRVYHLRTATPFSTQTLTGHSGAVRCLLLEGNRLFSGSTDGTIKVWDLSSQETWSRISCRRTLTGHLDTVRCLQLRGETLVSGGYDSLIKVWDVRGGLLVRTISGHEAAVLCVDFDSNLIVSGSADTTIRIWTHAGVPTSTLRGHRDAVTCLQFDHSQLVSGSLDRTLRFWAMSSGVCLRVLDCEYRGHTDIIRSLQMDSWKVISAGDDRTLRLWNRENFECLGSLHDHDDGVTCLHFNETSIVSGSYDKTVKLWEFGTTNTQ